MAREAEVWNGALRRELPQTALRGSSDVYAQIRCASRAVTPLYEAVLSPAKLKASQFLILQTIKEHGEATQSLLASEHGISPESISRRLAGLRNAGLVNATLAGRKQYHLTAAGEEAFRRAWPYWLRAQQRLRGVLGAAAWDSTLSATQQVTRAARAAEDAKIANSTPDVGVAASSK